MEKNLINYLILPKGVQSIIFKSYVYFIPFLYSLTLDLNHVRNFLIFLLIFGLFEFIINPSRYQLNDLADYKGDQQRQYHWRRPVNKDNKFLVLAIALSRFTLGTSIAFFLDIKLGYLAIAFLTLHLFYDHFAKKHSPILSIFAVSIAYPLRSLTIFYGLDIPLTQTSLVILLSIFLYSTYMVVQWRKNETFFILQNNLFPKPHFKFFSNHKINFLICSVLLVFLFVFISMIASLAKISSDSTLLIYLLVFFLTLIISLSSKDMLNKISAQSHNIIIAFLFVILTFNRFLIALAIALISTFIIFWYHRIYLEKFARNYFSKTYYDKT